MPTAVPRSLRNEFGEELTDDLSQWVRSEIREQSVPRDEYREVLSRLDVIEREMEVRFEGMDARLDRMDERFNQIDLHFDQMSAQFNERFGQMNAQFNQRTDGINERFDRMHEQMRVQTCWTVGAVVILGAIMTTLLAIAAFAA